ncbi:MarP family serine protease [Raineyella fluvialis]|uniref:MarP family serine protease n=1 Tax=Raineyella fluvialis TaxID=2662261 RepID=A0A5Q2FBN4_9ACTN|nr:MarP family serine protease [Raineyella fluvialis]QGF22453.1 MarP family serine protease [Raineyella fluvialis]
MEDAAWASLLLDVVLVLAVLGTAARGWARGILAGGLEMVGAVGGGALGLWGWSRLHSWSGTGRLATGEQSLLLVLVVLVGALLGSVVSGGLSAWLRPRRGAVVRAADRALGACGAAIVTVLVLGVVATAVRPIAPSSWTGVMADAQVVKGVEAVLPPPLRATASQLGRSLKEAVSPRAFSSPSAEPTLPVQDPDPSSTDSPAVQAAASRVIKVISVGCGGEVLGSGWVSANERVVTNAHVVAGGTEYRVQPGGKGRLLKATLVAIDPDVDVAVLYVPGLTGQPLSTTTAVADQSDVVVAGFPGGGAFTLSPGRVSNTTQASGDDIYGTAGTVRQIYTLRTNVEHGDSGGPVLTRDGKVAGTVFARSQWEPQTGYALTITQTAGTVNRGAHQITAVPSGACAMN